MSKDTTTEDIVASVKKSKARAAGKGSRSRVVPGQAYRDNYDKIFRKPKTLSDLKNKVQKRKK